jgi:hypothetical protein
MFFFPELPPPPPSHPTVQMSTPLPASSLASQQQHNGTLLALGFSPPNGPDESTNFFNSDFDHENLDGLMTQLPFSHIQWLSDISMMLQRLTGGFPVLNFGTSGRIVKDPAGSAHKVFRFELNRTDPIVYGSKRSELAMAPVSPHAEYTYRFKVYLPADYQNDATPEGIAQWHDKPDLNLGEHYKIPALSIETLNGHFRVKGVWDSKALTPGEDPGKGGGTYMADLGPYRKAQWNHFTVHIKWSYQNDGFVEVFENDKLVFKRTGPTYYNDQIGPYMKVGIYKWDWKERPQFSHVDKRVVYINDISEDEGNAAPHRKS